MKRRTKVIRYLQIATALGLGLIAGTPVFAAPAHIELVIFANNTPTTEFEWFLLPDEVIKVIEPIDEEEYFAEEPPQIEADILETQSSRSLEESGPIPVEAYLLTDFAKAIVENPNFNLLSHLSWVQEPVPKSDTKVISLDLPLDDSILSNEFLLKGEISVYEIAQLLQFDIHVTYKPTADNEKSAVYLSDNTVKLYEPENAYLLEEKRRVYINDIHYFDHPKFGVVFTIVRPEKPEEYVQ